MHPKKLFESKLRDLLKQVHPDLQLTKGAASQLNFLLEVLGKELGHKALKLANHSGKKTVSSRQVQNATRLLLQGELENHAVSEATKAVVKFTSAKSGEGKKVERETGAVRAGLTLSTSRSKRFLQGVHHPVLKRSKAKPGEAKAKSKSSSAPMMMRVGAGAPVYLTAVIEYVAFEILEIAGKRLNEGKKRTKITPRDFLLSIADDADLAVLLRHLKFKFIAAGVYPFIHPKLVGPSKKKKGAAGSPRGPAGEQVGAGEDEPEEYEEEEEDE